MARRLRLEMSPQLRRNLRAEYMVTEPVRYFLTDASELIRRETAAASPVDLGVMRRSHKAYVDRGNPPTWARVQVEATSRQGADYPWFVHQGTRPHFPPVAAITPWANRHGIDPWALAIGISRRGTRPQPWFETTIVRLLPQLRNLSRLAALIRERWERA